MSWLAESAERRANPRHLWPDAKTIVMLGMNYGPEVNPLATIAKKNVERSLSTPDIETIMMFLKVA